VAGGKDFLKLDLRGPNFSSAVFLKGGKKKKKAPARGSRLAIQKRGG